MIQINVSAVSAVLVTVKIVAIKGVTRYRQGKDNNTCKAV